ncbi:MAG: helix-hairpin-helix domain-containing protein [Anaerolineales bacterium]|nr:helix-hairpin-helix domain-containing protein [Anaerolineales bacterium]
MMERIAINTAPLEELTSLPGVGATLAERIIAARPFQDAADLRRVSGIGPAMMERLEARIGFEMPVQSEAEQNETKEQISETEAEAQVILLPEHLPEWEEVEEREALAGETPEAELPPWEGAQTSQESEMPEIRAEVIEEQTPEERAIIPVPTDPEAQSKQPAKPKPVTRSELALITFIACLITFILAVTLSLGILTAVNDGLRYATPGQMTNISQQIDGIRIQSDLLSTDMSSLKERVATLEDNLDSLESGLSNTNDQVETLSDELDALGMDIETLTTQAESLSSEINTLGTQVEELKNQNSNFQTFLEGLRDLLNNLLAP